MRGRVTEGTRSTLNELANDTDTLWSEILARIGGERTSLKGETSHEEPENTQAIPRCRCWWLKYIFRPAALLCRSMDRGSRTHRGGRVQVHWADPASDNDRHFCWGCRGCSWGLCLRDNPGFVEVFHQFEILVD